MECEVISQWEEAQRIVKKTDSHGCDYLVYEKSLGRDATNNTSWGPMNNLADQKDLLERSLLEKHRKLSRKSPPKFEDIYMTNKRLNEGDAPIFIEVPDYCESLVFYISTIEDENGTGCFKNLGANEGRHWVSWPHKDRDNLVWLGNRYNRYIRLDHKFYDDLNNKDVDAGNFSLFIGASRAR